MSVYFLSKIVFLYVTFKTINSTWGSVRSSMIDLPVKMQSLPVAMLLSQVLESVTKKVRLIWNIHIPIKRKACIRFYNPLCPSVGSLFTLWRFWEFWAHCSCANAPVTFSITAPAHPYATGIALFPALFILLASEWLKHRFTSCTRLFSYVAVKLNLRWLELQEANSR